MALAPCAECGREISSEAKACPQCGATNRNRPKRKIVRWVVAGAVVSAAIYLWTHWDVPECGSWRAERQFKDLFNNSPLAQTKNLSVTGVLEQKETSKAVRPEDQTCEVVFMLNNGEKVTYAFHYEKTEQGYFVKGQSTTLMFFP